ncbi:hypothetical protein CERSUDRAFT_89274 [Gelatoporia subvermispora B]|uniref:DUF6533 domain-containing protein n=1 Tax=Ceriporiopsis subvermispora (strain B) TaxID=914234 RepID=M2QGJ1_CERS8|nr:hypothetical protein CERSUDRAFT_89274 [Gelatoporia subvermispora B]
MAQVYGPLDAETLSYVSTAVIANYCSVAAACFVIYDHVCTMSREVDLMWGRKMSGAIFLYHMNRSLILLWTATNLVISFLSPVTVSSYVVSLYMGYAFELSLFVIWAVFSGMRVYALSKGNWPLTVIVILLSLVPVGSNAYYSYSGNHWEIVTLPFLGDQCLDFQDVSEATYIRAEIITRVCAMLADAIVLSVTWSSTYVTVLSARQRNVSTPLMSLLFRDGTLYFLGLLSLNALNIAGWTSNVFIYAAQLSMPLSSAIITHFLLNLRHLTQVARDAGDDTQISFFVRGEPWEICSQLSSIRFGSIIDNMGEQLVHGPENDGIDSAWENEEAGYNVEERSINAHVMYDS